MTYQVLARKWRPKNFSEMVGQEHVLKALVNALDNDRLHHAFLFTGTRGVGKTTIGRILAKSLNCEEGVSSTPCGKCSACVEINDGRFIDLIEVDAASRTKVEDTRELLDNVQYAPTRGRFKVYLIDEVHMLSNHSFNALLKTLEEPPPHVKFLLATTDPQKLPVTILSRCLQFNLKRLPVPLIAGHMQFVLEQEQIEFEPKALFAIANAADGSMRDALSLLDQSIAYGNGGVLAAEVHDMLGTIEHHHVENILKAVIAADAAQVLEVVAQVAEKSPDFDMILGDLISLMHRVAVAQMVPDAIDDVHGDRDVIMELAEQIEAEDLQLYYQIALIGKRDLHLAADRHSGLEMVLLRMLAFRPYQVDETLTSGPQQKSTPSSTVASSTGSTQEPAGLAQQSRQSVAAKPDKTMEWEDITSSLGLKAMARELAVHCTLEKRDNQSIHLKLDPAYEQICTTSAKQRLQQALSGFFNETIKLEVKVGSSDQESPAAKQQRMKEQKQVSAEQAIINDPFVQELAEVFNADLDSAVIRPVE